jgi:benzoate-CoA ligase family protein
VSRGTNASTHFVDRHLEAGAGARSALLGARETLTYAGLAEQVSRFAGLFAEAGIRAEDRVLLVLPDRPLTVACFWGLVRLGAVPVPLSGLLATDDYLLIAGDCRPRGLVVDAEHVSLIAPLWEALGHAVPAWTLGGDAVATGAWPLSAPLVLASPEGPCCGLSPDDVAVVQYTSGTTGAPKGVVHSHRGLLAVTGGLGRYLGLRASDVCLCTSKLSFGYGLGNSALFPLDVGASSVLVEAPADPYRTAHALATSRPTVVFSVPTVYAGVLRLVESGVAVRLDGVRLFVSSGERLAPGLARRWSELTGVEIVDCFGSTECLHAFMATGPGTTRGSCGEPLPGCEVRLLDEEGAPAAPGEPGLLSVRTPWNGDRYWNRHQESLRTMAGGWVVTGDVMRRDERGSYHFMGRTDDVLKVAGLKVSPFQIEECLRAHPAVTECAVVARPAGDGLTAVVACVQLQPGHEPGARLAGELRRHVRGQLSPYKVPRVVEFHPELPRTPTGKLARRLLRAAAASGTMAQ